VTLLSLVTVVAHDGFGPEVKPHGTKRRGDYERKQYFLHLKPPVLTPACLNPKPPEKDARHYEPRDQEIEREVGLSARAGNGASRAAPGPPALPAERPVHVALRRDAEVSLTLVKGEH